MPDSPANFIENAFGDIPRTEPEASSAGWTKYGRDAVSPVRPSMTNPDEEFAFSPPWFDASESIRHLPKKVEQEALRK